MAAAALVALWPAAVTAQLRPLDPIDWGVLGGQGSGTVVVGAGFYAGHAASLAGARGRLFEIGSFRATWHVGRAALQVSGAAVRVFREEKAFAAPVAGVRPARGEDRIDAGDGLVTAIFALDDGRGPWSGAIRFGVRLPTSDDREGLERDRTDFFLTAAGRRDLGRLDLSGELGMGIMGTRSETDEQVDPLLFAVGAALDVGWVRPDLVLVGQHDPRTNPDMRGNEDLGEIRLGLSRGERRWVRLGVVRGWETFSPDFGVTLETGLRF